MLSQAIPSTVGPERPIGRGCESSVASARPRHRDGGVAGGGRFWGQSAGPMNRFVSNFASRLDAKGRVSIPAPFRAVLARDGFEGLYVHPALDTPALDAGGHTLLNEIDLFLSTLSPYSDERDRLATALFGTSEVVKVDPEGRAVLT